MPALILDKNFASLDSDVDNLYELTDSDIAKMHEVLLELYDDISAFSEKYSLKLIAGGGTALGAVRHKGFIPWDDDMDLNLTRDDYEVFKRHIDEELGDKYDILAPGHKNGANCFLMRVLRKDTTLLNMIDEAAPYPAGIYIDITPIDYAPNSRVMQKVKGMIADLLRFGSYSVYWKQYRSRSLREYMLNSEGRTYYRLRIFVGTILSFRPAEKWFVTFDNFIKGRVSDFVTVAAGRKKYCGEIFSKDVFFPLKKMEFEGRTIYVYNRVDTYLKKLYGDFMRIPSPDEREKHLCLKLNFHIGSGERV